MTAKTSIRELLGFLGDPASYSPRPEAVLTIQTHGSVVALAGDFVYKVKKPVDFGFLDYSTLDRRRHFCNREVELNRRLCPDVYLGVLPIVRRNGRLHFGEGGAAEPAVEYAVHMRRLDDRRLLSSTLEQKQATAGDLQRVVDTLVPFYRAQPPAAGFGTPKCIREAVVGNLDLCARAIGPVLPSVANDALRCFAERFLVTNAELIRQRAAAGWVRDGHGDLRPMHIHLGERVVIYDCIEFNDNLRCIDVAADLAFLAMELDFAGRTDLSDGFLADMRRRLDDETMPLVLPFYACYRAAVRGKVAWLLGQETELPPDQGSATLNEARAYFRLALRYAMFARNRAALCVMGRVGTGKSSVAAALGELLGWPVFSSDRVRKELAGIPLHTRPEPAARARLYSDRMHRQTYQHLVGRAAEALGTHGGAIVDATFNRRDTRQGLADMVAASGGTTFFVELTAPDALIRKRLAARAAATAVVSDARLEDLDRLQRAWSPPTEVPQDRIMHIDTAEPLESVLRRILCHIA